MIWVTWLQHGREASVSAILLAGIAAFLLVSAHLMGADAQSAGTCHFQPACPASSAFEQDWHRITTAVSVLLTVVPALLGMFIAAPLLSGELERGTNLVAWSQSVTRLRWGTVKLAILITAVVITTGALAALAGWWRTSSDQLSNGQWPAFDIEGIAPVAYATFAFVLGTFAGLVLRRTVPAMAATLVVFTAVRVLVEANRASFQSTVIGPAMAMPQGSWTPGANYWADAQGQTLNLDQVNAVMSMYSGNGSGVMMYMHDRGVNLLAAYFPPDRFWAFQLIEAAMFFALAALLVGVSLWWLQHRAG